MIGYRYLSVVGGTILGVVLAMPACDEGTDTSVGGSTSSSTGTGASSSGSSSSTTSTGTGGAPLLTCPEPFTTIDGECDLLNPVTSCDPGFWCDQVSNVAACVSVQGTGVFGPGQPCIEHSECAAGLRCQMKKCTPICCPTTDEPCLADSGSCNIEVNLGGEDWVMMCSYLPSCTLLEDTCDPDSGYDCHIQDPDACLAVCAPPSGNPSAEGESCGFLNDCGESQLCNNNGGDDGVCRQLCNLNSWQTDDVGLGGCLPDRTCETVTVSCGDWAHLGICMPTGGGGGAGGGG
jgi:hypothetical protein